MNQVAKPSVYTSGTSLPQTSANHPRAAKCMLSLASEVMLHLASPECMQVGVIYMGSGKHRTARLPYTALHGRGSDEAPSERALATAVATWLNLSRSGLLRLGLPGSLLGYTNLGRRLSPALRPKQACRWRAGRCATPTSMGQTCMSPHVFYA